MNIRKKFLVLVSSALGLSSLASFSAQQANAALMIFGSENSTEAFIPTGKNKKVTVGGVQFDNKNDSYIDTTLVIVDTQKLQPVRKGATSYIVKEGVIGGVTVSDINNSQKDLVMGSGLTSIQIPGEDVPVRGKIQIDYKNTRKTGPYVVFTLAPDLKRREKQPKGSLTNIKISMPCPKLTDKTASGMEKLLLDIGYHGFYKPFVEIDEKNPHVDPTNIKINVADDRGTKRPLNFSYNVPTDFSFYAIPDLNINDVIESINDDGIVLRPGTIGGGQLQKLVRINDSSRLGSQNLLRTPQGSNFSVVPEPASIGGLIVPLIALKRRRGSFANNRSLPNGVAI